MTNFETPGSGVYLFIIFVGYGSLLISIILFVLVLLGYLRFISDHSFISLISKKENEIENKFKNESDNKIENENENKIENENENNKDLTESDNENENEEKNQKNSTNDKEFLISNKDKKEKIFSTIEKIELENGKTIQIDLITKLKKSQKMKKYFFLSAPSFTLFLTQFCFLVQSFYCALLISHFPTVIFTEHAISEYLFINIFFYLFCFLPSLLCLILFSLTFAPLTFLNYVGDRSNKRLIKKSQKKVLQGIFHSKHEKKSTILHETLIKENPLE